jgi:hypothetical protein
MYPKITNVMRFEDFADRIDEMEHRYWVFRGYLSGRVVFKRAVKRVGSDLNFVYVDGSIVLSASDSTFTNRSPGIGFDHNGPSSEDSGFGFSSFTASDGSAPDTQPPTVPTNLTAVAVFPSQIDLAWSASADNVAVTGYQIYRNGLSVGITSGTTYSDTGLVANTTNTYSVAAFDAVGNMSATSAPASATTLSLLTITANDQVKAYGAALPVLTASYSGFVNGDTPASLTTPATLSTTASPGSAVGIYPITVGGASSANYAIVFINGTLNVTAFSLHVEADDQSRSYGVTNPAFTGTLSGLQNGDDITAAYSTTATVLSPVGSYNIVPSLNDPSGKLTNYSVTLNNGTLAVTPAGAAVLSAPSRQLDGSWLLIGSAEPNRTYSIEASGDLQHWTVLGTAGADAGGQIRFVDTEALPQSARFYRTVTSSTSPVLRP